MCLLHGNQIIYKKSKIKWKGVKINQVTISKVNGIATTQRDNTSGQNVKSLNFKYK